MCVKHGVCTYTVHTCKCMCLCVGCVCDTFIYGSPLQQAQLIESGQQPLNSRSDGEAYTLFTVNSERASPIEVKVKANGVTMTMELDTGAVVSVIGEHTYLSTWPHNPHPFNHPQLSYTHTMEKN